MREAIGAAAPVALRSGISKADGALQRMPATTSAG
ncbi:hypothetical protein HNP29_005475 [Pseudomonas alcaligenes]|nr:hypothetical protein [Pseudomonas alcaligenes]